MPYNTRKINPDINPTGIVKRTAAFFIDLIASALVMLILFTSVVYPTWYNHFGGYEVEVRLEEGKEASGLFSSPYVTYVNSEDEEITVFDRAYRLDEEVFFDLSTISIDRANPSSDGGASFRIVANNWNEPADLIEVRYLQGINTYYQMSNEYFEFRRSSYYTAENTSFSLYEDVYLINDENGIFQLASVDNLVLDIRSDVSDLEVIEAVQASYNRALVDFEKTNIFAQLRQPLVNINIWGYAGSLVFGLFIFDFIVPLLLGEGRSLGKFLLGLALVDQHGYRIKWWQLLVRFIVLGGIEVLLSFVFFVLPLLISSAFLALTKRNQSLHDLIARTWVVDWQNSRIFTSEEAANEWKVKRAFNEETAIMPGGGLSLPAKAKK